VLSAEISAGMSFLGKGRRKSLGNLLLLLQSGSAKKNSTSWSNLFGSEYDALNGNNAVYQPIEQTEDGSFRFFVKMKLYEQKGEPIVERKMSITKKE